VNERFDPTVTVVSAAQGQAALDRWLAGNPAAPRAVLSDNLQPLEVPDGIPFAQLVAGCACCAGQLPLKVALIRLLRGHRPRSLLLLVGDGRHVDRVRALLADGTLGASLRVE
jgi:hypothetical protein